MSPSMILYFVGFALVFAGQRLLAGNSLSLPITGVGVLLVLAGVGLRAKERSSAADEQGRSAHGKALMLAVGGLLSLALYGLGTEAAVSALGLQADTAERWSVICGALWPILFAASSLPLLLVDLAIQDSPLVVQPLRVRQAIDNGLVAALGIALVFPLNYLASEHNKRWDLAYFKTTEAGEPSKALVRNLKDPVTVRLFQPNSSDVTPELLPYFEALAAQNPGNFKVEVLDHAAHPVLTKELKVRDNGYVALTMNEGSDDAVTKSWKVGSELDKAERNLKKLDEEFGKKMLDLAKGKRTAYFTVGHEEYSWKAEEPDEKLNALKSALQQLNFTVKTLGLAEGLHESVPDNADVVIVAGPQRAFEASEIESLQSYVAGGGAIWIAVEPDGEPLDDLLGHYGLKRGAGVLATDDPRMFIPRFKNISDRKNIVTNRYSSHVSTSTLSRLRLALATPGGGWLEEREGGVGKRTITVRSMEPMWADLDGDLQFSADTESKEVRPIAAVIEVPLGDVEPPAEGEEADEASGGRVVVTADASLLTDLAIGIQGNQVYISDAVNWLLGEEALSGTTNNEEDVRIEHTKGDQAKWFYGTSLLVPLALLLAGFLRVRSRKKGGRK